MLLGGLCLGGIMPSFPQAIRPYESDYKGMMVVKTPFTRPYFLDEVVLGGLRLDSHECWSIIHRCIQIGVVLVFFSKRL